jgi:murein tripeptide amidase MpaA
MNQNPMHALLDDPHCCGRETRIDFLPQVNPDGFELSLKHRGWRGNGNHCDLNRNFEIGWGHGERADRDQSSQIYQGEGSESESETRAVSGLMAHGGYTLMLDMHSAAARVYGYVPPADTSAPYVCANDRIPQLDRRMCESLAQLLRVEVHWLYTPFGALQCAAAEREHIPCFTIETPPPKEYYGCIRSKGMRTQTSSQF